MTSQIRVVLAAVVLALSYSPDRLLAQEAPFSGVARRTFANILKIPLADPDVSVSVRGSKEEEGIVVEDITWESLDGQHPVAYVMHPARARGHLPAILFGHGSSGSRESESAKTFGIGQWTKANGKTTTRLLGAARELARHGYLVLSVTHRGLDSRLPNTEDDAKELLMRGRNLMGAEVYELRQALTYLRQRADVDPNRIGMTGLSFGGITTFYTWLVDLRITAAAPICGAVGSFETYLRLVPKRSYHGFTLWMPDMMNWGDQADFAAAMAPRPLMLWAPTEDVAMPKQAVDRFVEVVRPAYERAGARDALVVYQRPGIHELNFEAFEAMKKFFDAHLKNGAE
jgi:dienelactone hydrolase